jgi:hypothetical protein
MVKCLQRMTCDILQRMTEEYQAYETLGLIPAQGLKLEQQRSACRLSYSFHA